MWLRSFKSFTPSDQQRKKGWSSVWKKKIARVTLPVVASTIVFFKHLLAHLFFHLLVHTSLSTHAHVPTATADHVFTFSSGWFRDFSSVSSSRGNLHFWEHFSCVLVGKCFFRNGNTFTRCQSRYGTTSSTSAWYCSSSDHGRWFLLRWLRHGSYVASTSVTRARLRPVSSTITFN